MESGLCERMPMSKVKEESSYNIVMFEGEQPFKSWNCTLLMIIVHLDCELKTLSYLKNVLEVPHCTLASIRDIGRKPPNSVLPK